MMKSLAPPYAFHVTEPDAEYHNGRIKIVFPDNDGVLPSVYERLVFTTEDQSGLTSRQPSAPPFVISEPSTTNRSSNNPADNSAGNALNQNCSLVTQVILKISVIVVFMTVSVIITMVVINTSKNKTHGKLFE